MQGGTVDRMSVKLILALATTVTSAAFQITVAIWPQVFEHYSWGVKWLWAASAVLWIIWTIKHFGMRITANPVQDEPASLPLSLPTNPININVSPIISSTISPTASPRIQPWNAKRIIDRSPNLVCTQVKSTRLKMRYSPERLSRSEEGSPAIVAVIANNPGESGSAPVYGVSAELIFRHNGKEIAAGFATWIDAHTHYVNFEVGQRNELILALVEENAQDVEAAFNPRTEGQPTFISQHKYVEWARRAMLRLEYKTLSPPLDVELSLLDSDGRLLNRLRYKYEGVIDDLPSFRLQ